jgi:hypothetical protein
MHDSGLEKLLEEATGGVDRNIVDI